MIGGIIFLICMLGFYGVVKGEPDALKAFLIIIGVFGVAYIIKEMNEQALQDEDRLMGAYMTCKGKIWIITEWDRSSTIILFPDEY